MGRRRKARELMVQAAYAARVGDKPLEEAVAEQMERRAPTEDTVEYVERLRVELERHGDGLDVRINSALTGWSPERVGAVERSILRLALLEILHLPETPPKVAISEAVDLAKTYSSDDASRFVNGVLDKLLKEEAGEDEAEEEDSEKGDSEKEDAE